MYARLKTVHRTVFLTPLTLSGFESLENKKRTEATPTVLLLFLARCKGYSRLRRLACSATAAAQQYPPHTSRLKTVRRTVFSTPLTLSGFESLENKKRTEATPAVLLPFLSVGYRKDVFMFFVDRVELSEFLMKSFALLTMKSKPTVLMKFSATQKMKLNPPIAAAISYAESVFHIAKQCFTHPQEWI